jgi:hypothetical protein
MISLRRPMSAETRKSMLVASVRVTLSSELGLCKAQPADIDKSLEFDDLDLVGLNTIPLYDHEPLR